MGTSMPPALPMTSHSSGGGLQLYFRPIRVRTLLCTGEGEVEGADAGRDVGCRGAGRERQKEGRSWEAEGGKQRWEANSGRKGGERVLALSAILEDQQAVTHRFQ